jgi:ketosteroid isomerase-like protein
MSQENVEIVRRLYDGFAVGGTEATLAVFAPDSVHYPFPEWFERSEYRGHEELKDCLRCGRRVSNEFAFEVSAFRDAGDSVVMLGETVGRIMGTGVPIRQPLGAVYSDFRDGRIGEARNFLTWREALEAVRLSEQPVSEENVEVVRAGFEAWNRGDMDALRELYDPDTIMRTPEGWPEPGPYVGREAVLLQWEQQRETWDADDLEPISDFIDAGDRVVVRFIWHGAGAGHGHGADLELTNVFTVRSGRIHYQEFFWDHAEALEILRLA